MESTRAQYRLRNNADIRLVFKEGKRVTCPFFTLLCRKKESTRTRVGVIAGKKLGGAVQRNRCKRRFRELARLSRERLGAGWDVLVLPRREAVDVSALILRRAWNGLLARAGLLHDDGS